MKKKIIISGINLVEGGTLSIMEDCLIYASRFLADKYEVIALVHSKTLFDISGIHYIEFPLSKKRWVYRLYYEWIYFYGLSLKLKPFLWLSLHDITPRINSERKAVYCHNPSQYYRLKLDEILVDYKFTLFNLFYSRLYKINILSNNWVIVQQDWLRKEFSYNYPVERIIVAHPSIAFETVSKSSGMTCSSQSLFVFPTYPRIFKNIEVIGEAVKILTREGYDGIKVVVTIDGTENRYANKIIRKFSDVPMIEFIGLQSREKVFDLYNKADCLIFPSKLETWGMPLSEFKLFDKPILAADLPYAHETIGNYHKVKYFDSNDSSQLASYMIDVLNGNLKYDCCDVVKPKAPFVQNWRELFDVLLA